ncbi:hypothetical protein D1872_51430 [compost metagenome]
MAKKFVIKLVSGIKVVDTAKEAVEVLGKEGGQSVTQKAILAGTVENVQLVDESEVEAIVAAEGTNEVHTDDASTDKGTEDNKDAKPAEGTSEPTSDDIEYPEVGAFKDVKAMKKFYKPLTDAQIQEWCELEGVTWKPNEHASINRMRMIMALKAKHFPDTAPKASSKTKSKYADYTTEQLVELALQHDVEVTGDNGDLRILRMKTIMALREAGVIA